jgi:adenylate cyclase
MQRKLTAILSADVVGYSGLMAADEAGTLERLKVNRSRIFDPQVAIHGGRIFKLIGDGALAEFPSVVAAVDCALAIQAATEKAATAESEGRRIRYRIGINLGEVIVEGDDIYGEGVNVAARLQALAPIGGVAVSKMVRDSIDGKSAASFDDMGEHKVKDHDKPVQAFAVRSGVPAAAAPRAAQAVELSVCVLPFANMSGDAEQEYFSDGISEDIITDLSKVSQLRVISRNSAFQYKGKNVDLPQVARDLKVSHVLEGSVRKSGKRVRITAQLIDGANNGHVWAERYDRDMDDIFALQDEISEAIVKALRVKLLPEEKKAIETRGTDNVEAYNFYLMARQYMMTGNLGDARRSEAIIRLCTRATELDPDYARAWAMIAIAKVHLRFYIGAQGDTGLAEVERALALDENLADAHAAKAAVLTFANDTAGARAEAERALALDPESFDANAAMGRIDYQDRRFAEAIVHLEKAAASNESDIWSVGMLLPVYSALGDKAGEAEAARRVLARTEPIIRREPNHGSAIGYAVSALMILGEFDRARELMSRALILDPDNMNMRYNFACALIVYAHDHDGALDLFEPLFERLISRALLNWSRNDPDIDPIRGHPRFLAMMAKGEARLADEKG